YDFVRKRLSILVASSAGSLLVTKGALGPVLSCCRTADAPAGGRAPLETVAAAITKRAEALCAQGQRVLAVASRDLGARDQLEASEESGMTLAALLVLAAPLKPGVDGALAALLQLGVATKIVTGDSRLVAAQVAGALGLRTDRILTGPELDRTSGAALIQLAAGADVFGEVEPHHKERIVLALRKGGAVVGFMGDGINDVAALHAADVSLSVNDAVDVAKEAADIVLLEKDLGVLVAGVTEGRRTFANTLKYVFMATSANFGNMFSMAGASLFLPFLPLLPKQVLLTNLLTDLPEMAIAGDRVDPELLARPRRWDLAFIRRFMLSFGLLSSVFDFL